MKFIPAAIGASLVLAAACCVPSPARADCGESPLQRAGREKFAANGPRRSPTCYDWNNRVIPCRFAGSYGELIYGRGSPDMRFADNADGTVTDRLTGLIWMKNAGCLERMNWSAAVAAVVQLKSGDCGSETLPALDDGSAAGDWRLPQMDELCSLIDFGHRSPALPKGHPFVNIADGYYWSSTRMHDYPDTVWVMYPESGTTCYDTVDHPAGFVWAVRDSKDRR